MSRSLRATLLALAAAGLTVGACSAGVSRAAAAPTARDASAGTTARLFAKVTGPDPGAFGTSLEGAAFDRRGGFYFVNPTAPAGPPKLMRLDLKTGRVSHLYADSESMLNCIGFGPGGAMYLCDIRGRKVVRFDPAAPRVTHVAIEPGTRRAFVTTSGPGGGYIYTFRALAAAPAGAANGG